MSLIRVTAGWRALDSGTRDMYQLQEITTFRPQFATNMLGATDHQNDVAFSTFMTRLWELLSRTRSVRGGQTSFALIDSLVRADVAPRRTMA